MLCVIDSFLVLFNTSCGIYSIPTGSEYRAVFFSINNETQGVSLLFLSWIFITHTPTFILGNLYLEKKPH